MLLSAVVCTRRPVAQAFCLSVISAAVGHFIWILDFYVFPSCSWDPFRLLECGFSEVLVFSTSLSSVPLSV